MAQNVEHDTNGSTLNRFRAPTANLDINSAYKSDSPFSINGRISRRSYAWQLLLYTLGFGVLTVIPAIGFISLDWTHAPQIVYSLTILGTNLWLCFLLIKNQTIRLVQRLHDINLPGQYGLLVFIPIVGQLVFLFVALRKGDSDKNQFGAAPPQSGNDDILSTVFILMPVPLLLYIIAPMMRFWVSFVI